MKTEIGVKIHQRVHRVVDEPVNPNERDQSLESNDNLIDSSDTNSRKPLNVTNICTKVAFRETHELAQ